MAAACVKVPESRRKLFTEIPQPQPEKKLGQLSPEQLDDYFTKGYVLIKDFFPLEQLQTCRDAIDKLVDKVAHKLYDAGKVKSLYENEGFFTRLIHLEKDFPGANIVLIKMSEFPEAFQNLWTDEKLLNIAEQIVGPDIMGSPVWNIRVKTPNNEATVVPWHQDSAYMDERAVDIMQLTAWIPFLDADETNGTLQMVEGFHKGKLMKHVCCYGGTWYVEILEDELKNAGIKEEHIKTCYVPYGGLLLFNNMTPHRSLPNFSNVTRWSVDLRWQSSHENPAFHNIKPGIVFRTKDEPNLKPDWKTFNSIDREKSQLEAQGMAERTKDPFDTTITGPWMNRWELVYTNRHTASHEAK